MEIWQAIILGAVQGIAEFLPISSSGHLILLQQWFGISGDSAVFYTIMLHIGTLIPVIAVLRKQIVGLFKDKWRRFWLLVLATIPAGLLGLLFNFLSVEEFITENYWILSIAFMFTAGEMVFSEIYSKKRQMVNSINVKTALFMGCGQAVGVVSGISRSGSAITGGCLAKVDREENASFAFLMSIPIILAAVGLSSLEIIIGKTTIENISWLPLILGVITAMVVGYLAIKLMLRVIKRANYKWFAVYLVLLSVANVIVYVVTH